MTNAISLRKILLPILICLLWPGVPTWAQPTIALTPVISSGLSAPVDVVSAGDGTNRLFVVERGGTIKVYSAAHTLVGTFLTVTGVLAGGEQGLLSLAFHPNYATNGYFFVYYTNAAGSIEIARYQVQGGNPNLGDPSTKTVILNIPKTSSETNHNGGKLNFGPDGYLYFGVGDGGGTGDPDHNAQNGQNLLGKMVRIDVNSFTTPPYYTIPATNPFATATDTLHAIYAFGLRNPWRWSFDRANGNMWLPDVGQDVAEEVNYRAAGTAGGINFGWRCYEGTSNYNTGGCLPLAAYTSPIFEYGHNNTTGGFAITGGYVYRGSQWPTLAGYYICADFISDNFWLIQPNGTGWQTTLQAGLPGGIASFGEAENGELYALALGGILYQVGVTGALPVTLLSFSAKAYTGYNEIRWKATREIDLQAYEIECSSDGSAWTRVGTVAALENNTDPDYTFKHATNLHGTIYYRLKMLDKDNTYSYSKIVSVETDPERGKELQLFPTVNTNGQLQVQLNEGFSHLQVFNMHGKVVFSQSLKQQKGVVGIDIGRYSKGMYTVVASRTGKTVSKPFLVQ
ncbi:PQQ-dependent sugar dehydrogenase [Paraflavitalea sp. CAU 1676]|uniref:PQQ-dependent sugar dehydrogenase n=1 Tax=Paraflavitalea sp. CAU 1676 TaxID=3032598 RepID=UPI0023DB2A73|nr:PQQ-dependent sugar dehydrogenase [Paraflavitalea sp. CAU 1676]MDF2189475.1 PQQ-dependent sugar dehydrogenase [Paraflavitalea sp. CAU 1676]